MQKTDRDYYQRRQREERERADTTSESSARRAHQEMAERYAELLGPGDDATMSLHG